MSAFAIDLQVCMTQSKDLKLYEFGSHSILDPECFPEGNMDSNSSLRAKEWNTDDEMRFME
jgi:hypothetical protein